MYTNALVRNSLSWNTTEKKTEGSWTRGRIIFLKIILFRLAVFWKLKYLGYYGRGGVGLGLGLGLTSQTLYLPSGGRKGSGNRAYNDSFPSPRIVGNNTLACIAYGVWFYIWSSFHFAHAWLLRLPTYYHCQEQGVNVVSVSVGLDLDW